MSDENLYTPPESNLIHEDLTERELASRWARLGASLIDGVIAMIIVMPIMVITGGWQRALENNITFLETSLYAVLGLAALLVVHGYFLAKDGQTIGKKALGIKIVDVRSGNILPLSKVFLARYLPVSVASNVPVVGQFLVLIDALFIFTKDKRCVHDHIAGTKVVRVGV